MDKKSLIKKALQQLPLSMQIIIIAMLKKPAAGFAFPCVADYHHMRYDCGAEETLQQDPLFI